MTRYDEINEVRKHESEAMTFEEILKFNPYHGADGRFSSSNGAHSMTVFTNSPAGQKAIANIRDRELAAMAAAEAKQKQKEDKQKQEQEDIGNTKKQKKHKDETKYGDVDFEGVNEQTYKQVAKDLGVNENEAIQMVDAVNTYSDGAYKGIRAASRGEDAQYKDEADQCEKFINASPKWAGGQLSRGLKIYDEQKFENMIAAAQEGRPIDLRGLSSWSSEFENAKSFSGGDYPVILRTNKKSTNRGTSIRHLSEYRDEDEVLVSSKAKFMPTKMEMKNGTVIIYGDIK
jgi:hypothetical protein